MPIPRAASFLPQLYPYLDPKTKQVELEGHATKLTLTEFRLFSCLVFNEGKVVPFSQLIAEAWGGEVSLDTLHFHMRHLKQKLGINSVGPYRLLKYRGEGYCFCGENS